MRRIIIAPGRYIQGKDELKNLSTYTKELGSKPFILVDSFVLDNYKETLESSFDEEVNFIRFAGECSHNTINHLVDEVIGDEDVVIAIGGGKTLDTAKVVADRKELPIIICPTAASTDAPTSGLSVIYSDDGVYEEVLFFKRNPDLVLVDTSVIVKAPVRLLVAGIGDALATFYEMRSNYRADKDVISGAKVSRTAYAVAEACKNTLMDEAVIAVNSAKDQALTKALDNVIEANTFMSGLGFESGGVAVAHGVHDALTVLDETHDYFHGEKVAFGVLCQLVMENAPIEEIDEVLDLCKAVGLPTNLKDIGVTENIEEKIRKVAKAGAAPENLVHNCPFEVTEDLIYATIMTANQLGQ